MEAASTHTENLVAKKPADKTHWTSAHTFHGHGGLLIDGIELTRRQVS